MSRQATNPANEGPRTLRRIIDALDGLEFGAVEITVHHSRIVQIERREKLRFEKEPRPSGSTPELPTRD